MSAQVHTFQIEAEISEKIYEKIYGWHYKKEAAASGE